MQEDKHEISKDKDCQDFLAGIKELTRELTQIRERAAIEYTPIVEVFNNTDLHNIITFSLI